jgi:thiamine biosynthesis lipoprotein
MQRHRFDAMGTWVECLVEAPACEALTAALHAVEDEFERLEDMLSRFRPDSELSRLNRERSLEASDELRELVELGLEARERSGGRFDPTLHDALVAAGYDRSFDELEEIELPSVWPRSGGGDVSIDGTRIELGPDASLDLGGIAKGYAADRGLPTLATHGPALVNAGGDIAISGPRSLGAWPVAVELPDGFLTLALDRGGLATSGRNRRRWRRGDEERHHLIDPRTVRSAEGGPLTVTVAAETAIAAEVRAKELFLAGADAEREAEAAGTPAVIVGDDGQARLVGIAQ